MENVTKALLIAAGMFMAILIISALVVFYDEVSAFYQLKHENTIIQQNQKFNAKFEGYNKKNIRGSDLISFMNKVIDYNAKENNQRIKVTITLGGADIIEQFKYEVGDGTTLNQYLTSTITNTSGNDWRTDKQLVAITNTPVDLGDDLASWGITNISDTQLQQLATGISYIMAHESELSSGQAYNRLKRADLVKDILGIDLSIREDTGLTVSGSTRGIIAQLKNTVSQYYQYIQFKRAYFDCTEMIYNTDTKRIVEMNFKLQIKDGLVVFD